MASYSFNITYSATACPLVHRWCLDSPTQSTYSTDVELSTKGLNFRGWALPKAGEKISLVLISGDMVVPIEFNEARPDVVTKVLKESSSGHPSLLCGFNLNIPLKHSDFQLAVITESQVFTLVKGVINGKFNVLRGREGWLFLDNDSNQSVEQFTGKVKLTWTERRKWKSYFKSAQAISNQFNMPMCLVVAPSKEMVLRDYYPYKQSVSTPILQFLKLIPDEFNLILPIDELEASSERTFRVCDTHWTCHGARIATTLLAANLTGSSLDEIKKVFSQDLYEERQAFGDLGTKLYPPVSHSEDFLKGFNYRQLVVYDNQLPNFGRVMYMHCSDAKFNKTLLMFGSSSAYTMFNYLCRLFTNVIFFHTAGNIDETLVNSLKPDYVAMQTNARFVVKAPKVGERIHHYIADKKGQISPSERKEPIVLDGLPQAISDTIAALNSLNTM